MVNAEVDLLGTTLITPYLVGKLVRKGITISDAALEVRGLKWEIEFRINSELIGRVRKDDFLLAISCVPPG